MMLSIKLLGFLLATANVAEGSTINRNGSSLMNSLKDFRETLVDQPSKFFDLELAINNLDLQQNTSTLNDEITTFRKEMTKMSGELQNELFDIEHTLNSLFDEDAGCRKWRLGMNLNPDDGAIMDYTHGWYSTTSIGTKVEALTKDYKNQSVWTQPANYISIVRHQTGIIDAVKVFKFLKGGVSLFTMFNSSDSDYYNKVVTEGGPIQFNIGTAAPYMSDDPIFSVAGDLLFNYGFGNDGVRIALTGIVPLFRSDKFHGLGGHNNCDPKAGTSSAPSLAQEVDVLCPDIAAVCYTVQGGDHGSHSIYTDNTAPVHGNYAIYISQDATRFPKPGQQLQLEMTQCED